VLHRGLVIGASSRARIREETKMKLPASKNKGRPPAAAPPMPANPFETALVT
jgi:hypothetical protein